MTTKLNTNYYNEKLSIKLGPLVKVRFRSARYYRHDDRIVPDCFDESSDNLPHYRALVCTSRSGVSPWRSTFSATLPKTHLPNPERP